MQLIHLCNCNFVIVEIQGNEVAVLTPISFLDLTKVRVQGSGFLLAHRLWTVYLQPAGKNKYLNEFKTKYL